MKVKRVKTFTKNNDYPIPSSKSLKKQKSSSSKHKVQKDRNEIDSFDLHSYLVPKSKTSSSSSLFSLLPPVVEPSRAKNSKENVVDLARDLESLL